MAGELQKAIVSEAKSDTDLNTAVSGKIYYGKAQTDAMPYVVFYVVGDMENKCFRDADSFDDALVQFSVFDDSPGVETVEDIYSKLRSAFNRVTLTWSDTYTGIGCSFENRTGPTWLDDCWQLTADFMVTRQ